MSSKGFSLLKAVGHQSCKRQFRGGKERKSVDRIGTTGHYQKTAKNRENYHEKSWQFSW